MDLIDIFSFNALIIHKKGGKLNALNFSIKLIEEIVEKYGTEVQSVVEGRWKT